MNKHSTPTAQTDLFAGAPAPVRLPTHAISVRQPWGHLIVAGYKDIENRTWHTPHRGRLLIHAAVKHDPADFHDTLEKLRRLDYDIDRDQFMHDCNVFGGIIGAVTVADITESSDSPWYLPGNFAWHLADPKPLPFFPCTGRLGLFPADYQFPPAP